MRQLSPVRLRALRERLGWSARQLGAFLDRSHQTIYNWESGSTQPDDCVNAILHALKTELDRRSNSQHGSAVSDWIDQLENEGLNLLFHQLMSGHSSQKDVYAELVGKSKRNGCLLVDTPPDQPPMYVLPLTKKGLETLEARLEGCMDKPSFTSSESSLTQELRSTT